MSQFLGEVVTEWLAPTYSEDREMMLTRRFVFVDSQGETWIASAGCTIDGASIPPELWSLVGSPFTGDYRRASVLHDVACQQQLKPARDVHRMFYEAMLCDGVEPDRALIMYAAVRLFGPSWGNERKQPLTFAQVEQALDTVRPES